MRCLYGFYKMQGYPVAQNLTW